MAAGGSIYIDLILRDASYIQGTKRAKGATSDFEAGIKSLARSMAPLLGGAGFLAIANSALNSADAIEKSAKALGLTAEQFQKFSYAAKLGGIDSEVFTNAIIKLNNQIAAGKLPYADTASAILGVSNQLKGAKDGIERARIASEAFGSKLGAKLIPALGGGADGLIKMGKEAEALGIVFDNKLTSQAENFKDQIEILGEVATKNFQGALLKQFVGDSKTIRDIYTDPNFIAGVRGLGEVFGAVAQAMLAIGQILGATVKQVRAFVDAIVDLGHEVGSNPALRNFFGVGPVQNPNVSFTKPNSVTQVTHDPAAIDAALKAKGLPGIINEVNIQLVETNKAVEGITDKLAGQTEILAIQNDHYGENKNAIDSIVQLKQIELDLAKEGITLSEKDKALIKEKLKALEIEKNLQDELQQAEKERLEAQKKIQEEQEKQQQLLAESIQNIKEDLADNFIDAIKGAKSLSQAFKDVAASIAEAVTKAQILKLLSGGDSGGGDILGALFGGGGSSFFDSIFPSYDVGTPFVPQDQMAQLHKGEMVIPKIQADAIRKGQAGNNIVMNISTPDAGSFMRSQSQVLAQTQQMLARAQRRNN